MKQYRKKPVTIEAVQFDGLNPTEIKDFVGENCEVEIYDNEAPPAPKKEKNVPHYEVEIEGKTFVSQDGSQEKNCTTCGIYKLRPPRNMAMYPLCFEYSCHNHKIYELCASHHLTWKEK